MKVLRLEVEFPTDLFEEKVRYASDEWDDWDHDEMYFELPPTSDGTVYATLEITRRTQFDVLDVIHAIVTEWFEEGGMKPPFDPYETPVRWEQAAGWIKVIYRADLDQ